MKVLIVDDNADDARILRYVVESRGHQAIAASNGREGLEAASVHMPDLIISDVMMPVLDGFQFLRELRRHPELGSMPFIFYSASYVEDRDVKLAAALGADGYIIKPVEPNELWRQVENILRDGKTRRSSSGEPVGEDAEYLKKYAQIVAAKLEAKVAELQKTLAERKKAEEALAEKEAFIRNILDTVDEGFIVVDREFRIISANRAFCRSAGMDREDIIGKPCWEVSHKSTSPCFTAGERCIISTTLKTGESCRTSHVHVHADGTRHFVELRSFPLISSSGDISSAIETIIDVTDKKILEDQLAHVQKLESLGTLAGGVAHDFNNILSVISGYCEMIRLHMDRKDPNYQYMGEILKASERASQLTQALLIFSRKEPSELRPVNVCDLVEGMKKMVLRIIGEDIETSIKTPCGSLVVMGDGGRLEQMLMNFAVNARDAMPQGGLLSIEAEPVVMDEEFIREHGFGTPGGYVRISFADSGIGMDEAVRSRIFEPFFTTKEAGRGTGLGLSTVYGIVKQHNGHIECRSEPGRGTCFSVYLPLVEQSAAASEEGEQLSPPGGGETILMADDDEGVRKFFAELLGSHGYVVIEASDGEEAVRGFEMNKDAVDLCIFDVVMPRKGGREALREIAEIKPDVKAVFISGYSDDVLKCRDAIEEGFPVYRKPVRPRDFLGGIRALLDGKK